MAIADSVRAIHVNPAGLAQIPRTEINLSSGGPWFAAGRAFKGLRLAAYAAKSDEPQAGPLDSSVWEAGLGVGAEPLARIRVGVALAWSRLELDGQRIVSIAPGADRVEATVHGDSGHLRVTAGALIDLVGSRTRSLPLLRLGLAYQPGFDWAAQIATGAAPADIDLRRPSMITAGLALRTSARWGFSAQGDFIRYREVVDALRRNAGAGATGFGLPDAVEPRVGGEFTAPLWCGCGTVKVRGWLQYRSPGTLEYEGADPLASAAFSHRRWRTVTGMGTSFFTEHYGNAVRLDLDARDVFDGPELAFGIVWRF